jgi:hypothetical protein
MPRRIVNRGEVLAHHPRLVKKLVAELAGAKNTQPVIVEEIIPATASRHVHVIWDQWRRLPEEERSDVIWKAYCDAEGEEGASNITIATGATPREALALGLLPFEVRPLRKRTDVVSPVDLRKAIQQELTNTLLGSKSEQLRYATLEDAEEAKTRLEKALPGSRWAVVQDAYPDRLAMDV